MKPAPYEESLEWVARVIRSCDTLSQLDTAYKVLVNYFKMYIFRPKDNLYQRTMIIRESPLYYILDKRRDEIKSRKL